MLDVEMIGGFLLGGLATTVLFFMPLWASDVAFVGLGKTPFCQEKSPRFNSADIAILMAYLSLIFALVQKFGLIELRLGWGIKICLVAGPAAFVVFVWLNCIGFMQKRGIFDNLSRVATQVFVFPSAIYALALLINCIGVFAIGCIAVFVPDYHDPVVRNLPTNAVFLLDSTTWLILTRYSFLAILARTKNRESKLGNSSID